jgi:hypothetical protein
MRFSGNRYATAKRLRRHHGSKALWWAEEYATANRGTKYGKHWAAVHDILKRAGKKNPPKLDKVVVRYAERVYRDLIAAIESGKLVGECLYVSPLGSNSTREEWQYGLQWHNRKIDLIVTTTSDGGATWAPDDKRKPVKIEVQGRKIPNRGMFIHEFSHYLQSKHGLLTRPDPHASVADYLDTPNERDAYFIQFLSDEVLPKLRYIAKTADPAEREDRFKRMFGTKKAVTARVTNYFKFSGHWKYMKPQTRKHHIDRLTEYIEHIRGS